MATQFQSFVLLSTTETFAWIDQFTVLSVSCNEAFIGGLRQDCITIGIGSIFQ